MSTKSATEPAPAAPAESHTTFFRQSGWLVVATVSSGVFMTATQVVAVVIFVVIEFLLIIIPFVSLELRPEATKAALKGTHDWLLGHAMQLMAGIALLLGAYLAVSGLVRLS